MLRIGGTTAGFGAYFLSRLLEVFPRRQVLVLSSGQERAREFKDNLAFFFSHFGLDCRVELFPEPGPREDLPPEFLGEGDEERLRILGELAFVEEGSPAGTVVVAPVSAAGSVLPPREEMVSRAIRIRKGEISPREELLRELISLGFRRVSRTEEPGEFSARGGIVDIYSPSGTHPVRLEFDGDRVDSIRSYEVMSQRSISEAPHVLVTPVLFPEFHAEGNILSDYFAPDALVVAERREAVEREAGKDPDRLDRMYGTHPRLEMAEIPLEDHPGSGEDGGSEVEGNEEIWRLHSATGQRVPAPRGRPAERGDSAFQLLADEIRKLRLKGMRMFLVAPEEAGAERLSILLEPYHLRTLRRDGPPKKGKADVQILVGDLRQGFRDWRDGVTYITEEEIFGPKIRRRGTRAEIPGEAVGDFSELREGDYLVHVDYGIGIFRGLKRISVEGDGGDFLLVQYLGGDFLYLPVDRMNLIRRYWSREGVVPTLDKLGGKEWEKRKRKVSESVRELAEGLVRIYASRQVNDGFAFSPPDTILREFESGFPYTETADQSRAIAEVVGDLQRPRPMDRLVCGDVGFGKTEVALRAAFKAAMDGKQVALLAPTTVLVEQHFKTFRGRMGAYPIRVEALSRFRTKSEQSRILKDLKEGKVDVLIGTHRLLSNDVAFRDLGLLIIDEEHRFGVAQKEKIRSYRSLVDVLTLTATPIPRTLQMALSGIRDLSLISTPPPERFAVHNVTISFRPEEIKDAVTRELSRGGQVFFVHNRVRSIRAVERFLGKILPGVPIGVAHGQMQERELEKVMIQFLTRRIQVLLCTAIIGSGLDIPTANTILINRADHFGLSDLYQLRGRVGRGKEVAYCYFIIPRAARFSEGAVARLRAIKSLTELGSGYRLAVSDMEIRGAGEIFGPRQSGHVEAVGYDLYLEMLEQEIRSLKGGEEYPPVEPEIRISLPALIPEDYIEASDERLEVYRRLTSAPGKSELDSLEGELRDRFGEIPVEVNNLLQTLAIKFHLRALRVKKMEEDGRRLFLWFEESTPLTPEYMIGLVQRVGRGAQLTPEGKLVLPMESAGPERRLGEINEFLDYLKSKVEK